MFFPFSFSWKGGGGECSIVRGQSYIGGISAALLWKGRGKGLYGFSFLSFFFFFFHFTVEGGGRKKGDGGKHATMEGVIVRSCWRGRRVCSTFSSLGQHLTPTGLCVGNKGSVHVPCSKTCKTAWECFQKLGKLMA